MKSLWYVWLVLFPFLSLAQEVSDTVLIQKEKKDLSFIHQLEEAEVLKLNFENIDEKLFLAYESNYDNKISFEEPSIKKTPFSFSVFTNVGEFLFRFREENYGGNYTFCDYGGYLKPLNLYLIYQEDRLYQNFMGLDSLTGEKFELFGFNKHYNAGASISKKDEQLLFYATFEDEDLESNICIYHLEQKKLKNFFTEDWSIDILVWIDEQHLALKVTCVIEKTEEKNEPISYDIQYLKATIVE